MSPLRSARGRAEDLKELTVPIPATPAGVGPDDYLRRDPAGEHSRRQVTRALYYLADRHGAADTCPDVITRASVILRAGPAAPEAEQTLGVRLASEDLIGEPVTCRRCGDEFGYLPERPYYDATRADDGLCFGCLLAVTRMDGATPVLEGVVVPAVPGGAEPAS